LRGMDAKELPARPNLEQYKKQAEELLKGHKAGDSAALRRICKQFGRFSNVPEAELRSAPFALGDAQFVLAREHGFESWTKFTEHIEELTREGSPVSIFEEAADAVVAGDAATLDRLLFQKPELAQARSSRAHAATLLHYVSANGVEDFRQKSPKNAVEITNMLLRAGAEVDAEIGGGTALGLVATSAPPEQAGVQIALLETLLEAGASPDGFPGGWNPLTAAMANGHGDAAAFLAGRGARLDLEGAVGVGRLDVVRSFFDEHGNLKAEATKEQMEKGFLWACQFGRTSVVEFLLEKGLDPGTRRRCTGLHWAGYAGHADTVRALLEGKAPVDAKDRDFDGTPLGWAIYGWGEGRRGRHYEVVALLVAAGGTVAREWLEDPDRGMPLVEMVHADSRMAAALGGKI
jgi:hypothetical protein